MMLSRLTLCVFLLVSTYALSAQTSRTTAKILSDPTITLKEAEDEILDRRDEIARIDTLRKKVQKAISIGRFIQKLDSLAWIEFPVVLSDTVGNTPVHIVFDHLRMYPEYAQLEVIVGMELPQRKTTASSGEPLETPEAPEGEEANEPPSEYVELFFGTPDLKFSHDGGIIGDATIGLYSNVPIGIDNPSKFAMILKGRLLNLLGSGRDSFRFLSQAV